MKDIPAWIYELINRDRLNCSSCKAHFETKDLMAMGIQESTTKPHNDTLTIGLFCKKCNELTIFEIKEMTLLDLAFMLLDDESEDKIQHKEEEFEKEIGRKKTKKSLPVIKSKITVKEIQEASEFLKNIKTHDEFLSALGFSPEEIEKNKKL